MVCCVLLAGLLSLCAIPFRWIARRTGPLDWRPYASIPAVTEFSFSLSGRVRSIGYALEGIGTLVRREHNAWVHLVGASLVVAAGIVLRVSLADWRWLVAAIGMVLAAEAANTAIEELCNHLHPERHAAIKRVKDLAAGSVLLLAIAAGLIGAVTFEPYVARHFSHAIHALN